MLEVNRASELIRLTVSYFDVSDRLVVVNDNHPRSSHFWELLDASPLSSTFNFENFETTLYRMDDLQDEMEVKSFGNTLCIINFPSLQVTEVQKGGELKRELCDPATCLILDCGLVVYVWRGKNSTLDARVMSRSRQSSSRRT